MFIHDLSVTQKTVLVQSQKIGKKLGIPRILPAVIYQESSLGLSPVSRNHYGVGSLSYQACQTVLNRHPWLKAYFKGHNWANVLIKDPGVSIWMTGYFIKHCISKAGGDIHKALDLYRYGYRTPQGNYASRVIKISQGI